MLNEKYTNYKYDLLKDRNTVNGIFLQDATVRQHFDFFPEVRACVNLVFVSLFFDIRYFLGDTNTLSFGKIRLEAGLFFSSITF